MNSFIKGLPVSLVPHKNAVRGLDLVIVGAKEDSIVITS